MAHVLVATGGHLVARAFAGRGRPARIRRGHNGPGAGGYASPAGERHSAFTSHWRAAWIRCRREGSRGYCQWRRSSAVKIRPAPDPLTTAGSATERRRTKLYSAVPLLDPARSRRISGGPDVDTVEVYPIYPRRIANNYWYAWNFDKQPISFETTRKLPSYYHSRRGSGSADLKIRRQTFREFRFFDHTRLIAHRLPRPGRVGTSCRVALAWYLPRSSPDARRTWCRQE